MCVVAAVVQFFGGGGHHSGPAEVRGGPADRFGLDLVYPDDAPKGEDGRPRKEGTLEMVRRAVWGVLYADDAGVVSTSPGGLTRMMGVIVITCQEFGLTMSEKKA